MREQEIAVDLLSQKIEMLEQRLEQSESKFRELEDRTRSAEKSFQQSQRRMRLQSGFAVFGLACSIFMLPGNRSAIAAGGTVTLDQLAARVTILEGQVTGLKSAIANIRLIPGPQGPAGPQGARGPQGLAGTPADMNRVAALEAKTKFISANAAAKTTTFTGCNVYIQNGLGATNGNPANPSGPPVLNGLGNLVVGYNGLRHDPLEVRTGSHNLILGDQNSYSSYGGLVAGAANLISGPYATVSGGVLNTAASSGAAIGGGRNNTARGNFTSVSGGQFNEANGLYSSVSGGSENIAAGIAASISGGFENTAGSIGSSVSGGFSVTEQDEFGWTAGSLHSP